MEKVFLLHLSSLYQINNLDAFIVEKSCVSGAQFFSLFPEERRKSSNGEVPLGCASTYDGILITYNLNSSLP